MKRADLCPEIVGSLKRLPPPYDSHYGVVPPPPPRLSPSILPVASRHQAALSALVRLETLAGELSDPWLVSRVLARREAVSSSVIEGTNSTLDELLTVEETGGDPDETEAHLAALQVRNYALCLDALVPKARAEGAAVFTAGLIQNLHRAVMQDDPTYTGTPGELRQKVVWIGGRGDIAYSTYNPPPPADVERCLADTLVYLRGEGDETLPPSLVTRMAVAHAHFEGVHPFVDGNGRVGRLLLPLIMASEGQVPLYLSPYVEAHRTDYYDALKAGQQRLEWHAIVGFIADAIVGTVDELLATRRALEELRAIWLSRRPFRRNSSSRRALDILPHYPVITVNRLVALLGVSWPQAAQAVDQLVQAGVLTERTGYRRNRLFAAREALALINRPFGEQPVLPSL
jgi:Fic family protein